MFCNEQCERDLGQCERCSLEDECNSEILQTESCATQASDTPTGELRCDASCHFDVSGCTACDNDGVKEGNEECDGMDFGGMICADFERSEGPLLCNDCALDISECAYICGNGVREGDEECDGESGLGMSCSDIGDFDASPLPCELDTCRFATRLCSKCGNGNPRRE